MKNREPAVFLPTQSGPEFGVQDGLASNPVAEKEHERLECSR